MPGVLLLHGFTGTPFEVSYLGETLRGSGLVVSTPLLPGHGTSPRQLNRTTTANWRVAVAEHLDALAARASPVAVAGLSMGGLLALDAASRRSDIAAVVSLAAPLWLGGTGRLAMALSRLPRWATGDLPSIGKSDGGSDVRDPEIKQLNPGYRQLPLSGVVELCRLMRAVRRRLSRVQCPALVIHGRQDHTAPPASAAAILAAIASDDKQLLMLPESYHLIAHDVERDRVADATGNFLRRVLLQTGP